MKQTSSCSTGKTPSSSWESTDSSTLANSHDEQDQKSPSRASKGHAKISKWKKIAATLQPLSFLPSRSSCPIIVDFDDSESLLNSLPYLSLLSPDFDDYEDSGRPQVKAQKRFRDAVNCSLHLLYPESSGLAADGEASIYSMTEISSDSCRRELQFDEGRLTLLRTIPTAQALDVEEVCVPNVERNVLQMVRIARRHVVAKEFDEAGEIYSILLISHQSRLQNNKQGKHKRNYRALSERTLKQWIGAMHHNLAVISNLQGKHEVAVQHAQDALKIRKELSKYSGEQKVVDVPISSALLMVYSLLELGLANYGAGLFTEAQEVLLEALQVTYRLFPYESTLMAAKLWNILGCIQYDAGLLVSALDSFEESLEIQRSLLGNKDMLEGIDQCNEDCTVEPEIDLTLLHMSTTLSNIGIIFWTRSCFGQALSLLEEALILQQSILEDLAQPLFIQRAESLINRLCNEHLQLHPNDMFSCGGDSFRCLGSNISGSTFRRAISFVTTRETPSADNDLGDHLSTKVVHYIFHSIHMISLSAPQYVLSSSRKSNSSIANGVCASQQRLKALIDQSLQYYSCLLCEEDTEKLDQKSIGSHSNNVNVVQSVSKNKSMITLAEAEAHSTASRPLDVNFHLIHKYSIQCLVLENYTEAILLYQNILSTATAISRAKRARGDFDAVSGMALHHLGIIFMYAESYQDAKTVLLKAIEVRLEVCQRLEINSTSRSLSEDLVASYYAVAVSFASLALNLFLLSQCENAIVYFSKSLRFLKKIPSSPWIDAHISQVLNNIACIHLCISGAEIKNSLVALNAALSHCAPQNGQDHEIGHIYTVLLINKGMAELYAHDYGLSLITFDEVLRYLKCMKRLDEADIIMECMAYAMACSKSNGDENEKKTKQRVQNYKVMLANSSTVKSKLSLNSAAISSSER